MRKQDYAILAESIKKHRDSATGYASQSQDPLQTAEHNGRADGIEAVARTFARFASVDAPEFLKACGLD